MARDPRFVRFVLLCFAPLRRVHRVRFEGLENIPDRPVLLVANHNIGAAVEIFAILYAWEKRFGFRYDHPAYGLAHHLSSRVPGLTKIMSKVGAIPAEFEGAKRALESGASLLVFPGGNWEATRGFWRGNEVDFGEHRGWMKVAKNSEVDVLPISISGSYAVNPVFFRSRWLAKLLLLDRLLSVRWLPVTLGQCVWAGLFLYLTHGHLPTALSVSGAVILFATTPLVPILPAPITIRFGAPLSSVLPDAELERVTLQAIRQDMSPKKRK
jgi:1-acyl-sn-glycerol-3-phosphate acyltransferase